MPPILRSALAISAAVLLACAPAAAQQAVTLSRSAPRILSDITDTVKDDDGSHVTLRTIVAYDPASGDYSRTVTEAGGAVRERVVSRDAMIPPTAEEDASAKTLIGLDPEVSALIARSPYPVEITGGFPLVREAGHACGPGSRCVQYDVLELVPGETFARRLRFVVVDLQSVRVAFDDFDPAAEGNLSNPAARAESRSN